MAYKPWIFLFLLISFTKVLSTKKNVNDFTDEDIRRLETQWEESDEDKLSDDELPPWKRQEQKSIDLSKMDLSNPEDLLKATKKGQSVMIFAKVSGSPDKAETETITQIWQRGLFNAHLEVQLYPVESDRVIFMVPDGSNAWQVKEFLVDQDRCLQVVIDGKTFPGKADTSKRKDDEL